MVRRVLPKATSDAVFDASFGEKKTSITGLREGALGRQCTFPSSLAYLLLCLYKDFKHEVFFSTRLFMEQGVISMVSFQVP